MLPTFKYPFPDNLKPSHKIYNVSAEPGTNQFLVNEVQQHFSKDFRIPLHQLPGNQVGNLVMFIMILVGDQRVGSIGECQDIRTIPPYVWWGCWPLARLESELQLLQVIVGANNDTLVLICGKVREALSHQSFCVHCPWLSSDPG